MKNDIIIYELLNEISKYVKIINCYLRIWKNIDDTIDLSLEEHIKISIVIDWQITIDAKLTHKVYSLSRESKILINKKFDKMHAQGKLK